MERQPPDTHWVDFTADLSDEQHRQLMVALGSGLQEAHKAAQIAADNGLVSDARASLDLAVDWLTQARRARAATDDASENAP
jgi:hypothetical protein